MTTAIPPTSAFASRRDFLSRSWNGVGALALAGIAAEIARADGEFTNPQAGRVAHIPRRAKHCIFLFMQGGVSQVDSFEHKPLL
ncbi:MAG: twin-arginine translocation signal domain-containing protein, partial [Planctomycetaceae bacterium]